MSTNLGPPTEFEQPEDLYVYAWNDWFAEPFSAIRLTRGYDFDVEPAVMCMQIYTRAAKDGLKVTTNRRGDIVTFCAYREGEPKPRINV